MVAQSLAGLTVGVTAFRRFEDQAELLRRRGARVVQGTSVMVEPFGPAEVVVAATRQVLDQRPEIVVLTTSFGVRSWVDAAETAGLAERLVDVLGQAALVVARGPKARGAAVGLGLEVGWEAPGSRSSEIAAHLVPLVCGRRVVVQRDGSEVPYLAEVLTRAGADVVDVPIYRWTLPADRSPAQRLVRQAVDRSLDALTFTSAAAVDNLMAIAAADGMDQALCGAARDMMVVAVGDVTAEAVKASGLGDALAPERPRLGAMIHLLAARAEGLPFETVGRVPVRVAANAAVVGDEVCELAPREIGVLGVLAHRPGAVVAKSELRRLVWVDCAEVDDHAVEVTVGRLRRRLPPVLQVQTISKRGYRLVERV